MPNNPRAGERAENTRRIFELRDQGVSSKEIARRLGLSPSTVRNYISDPDGTKTAALKVSYGGVCVRCGGPTSGADGRARAAEMCGGCTAVSQHDGRYWTRERVLAAFLRFERDHGHLPTASELLHRRLPYLPFWNVVRREFGGMTEVFSALGRDHPGSGRRTRRETVTTNRNGYTVLRERPDGVWEVMAADVAAPTQREALNASLNGHKPEGRWLAIPMSYWRPRTIRPVTIYDWAEETPVS
jgi:AcrR family transcriptional regulator